MRDEKITLLPCQSVILSGFGVWEKDERDINSKTRNPEPGTRNPEPGTRNPTLILEFSASQVSKSVIAGIFV